MIHHIAIATKSLHKMYSYYSKIPNLIFEKEHFTIKNELRSIWFRSGKTILMLEEETDAKNFHALVFELNSLNKNEIEFFNSQNIFKITEYTFYFKDPEENTLGFSTFPEKLKNFPNIEKILPTLQ